MRARSLLTFPTDAVWFVFCIILLPFVFMFAFFRHVVSIVNATIQEEEAEAEEVQSQAQAQVVVGTEPVAKADDVDDDDDELQDEDYAKTTTTTTEQPRRYFTRAQARRGITVVSSASSS